MRTKTLWAVLLLLFFAVIVNAQQVRTCNLGGPFAVNKSRVMTSEERIIWTEKDLTVEIAQLEKPGSTHLAYRLCVLPAGTEIVIGGSLPWVKVCGNTFTPQGWSLSLSEPKKGDKGDKGDPGLPGKNAEGGDVNVNIFNNIHVINKTINNPSPVTQPPRKGHKKLIAGVITVAAIIGGVVAYKKTNKKEPPKPFYPSKNEVILIRFGP